MKKKSKKIYYIILILTHENLLVEKILKIVYHTKKYEIIFIFEAGKIKNKKTIKSSRDFLLIF